MRPQVIVNAAMSLDGRLSLNTGEQTRLSSEEDMERVRALRESVDAILVGINTVISDDPGLRPNDEVLRVVLDPRGRVPGEALVMNPPPRTLIAVGEGVELEAPEGVTVKPYRLFDGLIPLEHLLSDLSSMGIDRLLVEGGGNVIWSFLSDGLFDEFSVFIADVVIGGNATSLAMGPGAYRMDEILNLDHVSAARLDGGSLMVYRPSRSGKL